MSYLTSNIIGNVINLDDEKCPEDLVYEWESRVRAKFKENSVIDSEQALEALMEWYLQTIKEEAINFEEYHIVKPLTTKHLQHFKLQFIELNCCFMDNYLDNIEEILLFYVNLEIKCLPRKEKTNRCEFKRTLSSVFYKIISTLNVYLMNREDRVYHVIMKVRLNFQSEEAKDLLNIIYGNLLTKEPKNKSDLEFCRWYILYQKWKLIRKPEEWERMDEVMYNLHGRTPDSIKTNSVLKQILLPQSNSILDTLIHITEKHIIICEEYFKYIKSRTIQEDNITAELSNIETLDERFSAPDDEEDPELRKELRNFQKDISSTNTECDDLPGQIESIKVESDNNREDCQLVLPNLVDTDIVHEIVEDMEIIYCRKKNNVIKEAEKKCEKSFLDSISTTDYNDDAMEIVSSSTNSVLQSSTKYNEVETTTESADSPTSASVNQETSATYSYAMSVSQTEPLLAEAMPVESPVITSESSSNNINDGVSLSALNLEESTEVMPSKSNCVSSISNVSMGSPTIESTTCSKVYNEVITTLSSVATHSVKSLETDNLSSSVDENCVDRVDCAISEENIVFNDESESPNDISIENSVLVDVGGNTTRDYTVEISNNNKKTDIYYESINSCTSDEPKLRCIYTSKCKNITPCASPDYININDEDRFADVTCTSPDITSTSKDVPDFVETLCNGEADSIGNQSVQNDSSSSLTETESGCNNKSYTLGEYEEYFECNKIIDEFRENENVTQSNLEDHEEQKIHVQEGLLSGEHGYLLPDALPNIANVNVESLSSQNISNTGDSCSSRVLDERSNTVKLCHNLEITSVKTVTVKDFSKSKNKKETKINGSHSTEGIFPSSSSSSKINSTSDCAFYEPNRSSVVEFQPSSQQSVNQSSSYSDFSYPGPLTGKLIPKTLNSLRDTPHNSYLNKPSNPFLTVSSYALQNKPKEVKRVKIAGTMDSSNSEPSLIDDKSLRGILKKTSTPENNVRQRRRRSKNRIPRSIMNLKSFNHYKVKPNDPCIQGVPCVVVTRVTDEMYNNPFNNQMVKSIYKNNILSAPSQELVRVDYDKHTSHISKNDMVRYSSSNQVASLPDTISRWSSNSNSGFNTTVEGIVTPNSVNISKILDHSYPVTDFGSLNVENPKPKNYSKSTIKYPVHPQYNQFYHQSGTAKKNFSTLDPLQSNLDLCIINTEDNMNVNQLTSATLNSEELRRLGENLGMKEPEEKLHNRNISVACSFNNMNVNQPVMPKAEKSRRLSENTLEVVVPEESKKLHYPNLLAQDTSQSMLPKIENSRKFSGENKKLHRPAFNIDDLHISQSVLPKMEKLHNSNLNLSFNITDSTSQSVLPKVEKPRRFTGSSLEIREENKKLCSNQHIKPGYAINIMPEVEPSQRFTGNFLDLPAPEENKNKKLHTPASISPTFNINDMDIIQQSLVMAEITNLRNNKNELHYQDMSSTACVNTNNMDINRQPTNVPNNYPLTYNPNKYVNIPKDFGIVGPNYLNYPDDHMTSNLNYKSNLISTTDTEININTIQQQPVVPPMHSDNSQNYLPTAVPLNFDICMPLLMPTVENDLNIYATENDMNNYLKLIKNDSSTAMNVADEYYMEDSLKTSDRLPLKKRKLSESHSILSLLNNNTVSYTEPVSNSKSDVNTSTDPVSLVKEKTNYKEPVTNKDSKPVIDSFRFEKKYTQRAIEDSYVSYPNIPMMSIAALTEPSSRHMIKTAAARKEMPFPPSFESKNAKLNSHHNNNNNQPIINCHNGSAIVIVNYARTDVNVNVPSQPTSVQEYHQQESCRTREKSKMRR